MLSNQSRSLYRRSRLHSKLTNLDVAPAPDPMLVAVQSADDRVVSEAVRRLKQVDREIVMLDVWEELSRSEIAEVMGMTRAAVDQRIHRAYQKLARALEPVLGMKPIVSPPVAEEGGTMTHDQIREMVRRVNPVPDPTTLDMVPALNPPLERRMEMQTDHREVSREVPQRRWPGPLAAVGAAAAILVGALAFLSARDDAPVATPDPNAMALETVEFDQPLAPGAYWADTDAGEASAIRGTFVLDEEGWISITPHGARKVHGGGYVSLLVVEVAEVYESVCESSGQGPVAAAPNAEALGNQFATNGFTVLEALTPTRAFGQEGYRLVAEVPKGCANEVFRAWNGGVFDGRYYQGSNQMLEYWFLDVGESPVLVEASWFPGSSEEDVAALRAVLDTLVLTQ